MTATTTQTTATTESSPTTQPSTHETPVHVHGPGCSHGHHHDQTPFVRTAPKVGANDPCPCGSGKKHKKCCRT